MSAMKRELENKIKQDLDNKKEKKDLLYYQFKKEEIGLKEYMNGMNAVDDMHVMNGKIMNANLNGELI